MQHILCMFVLCVSLTVSVSCRSSVAFCHSVVLRTLPTADSLDFSALFTGNTKLCVMLCKTWQLFGKRFTTYPNSFISVATVGWKLWLCIGFVFLGSRQFSKTCWHVLPLSCSCLMIKDEDIFTYKVLFSFHGLCHRMTGQTWDTFSMTVFILFSFVCHKDIAFLCIFQTPLAARYYGLTATGHATAQRWSPTFILSTSAPTLGSMTLSMLSAHLVDAGDECLLSPQESPSNLPRGNRPLDNHQTIPLQEVPGSQLQYIATIYCYEWYCDTCSCQRSNTTVLTQSELW